MTRRPERGRGGAPPPKHLPPEEIELWRHAMRDTKPLQRPPVAPSIVPPPAAAKPRPKDKPAPAPAIAPATPPPALPASRRARIAGLDQGSADRLRRGKFVIDARLDLHGLTQDAAHDALRRFIADSAAAERRCVLVITGKGAAKREADSGFMPERSGVLRGAVPRWLAEPEMRVRILAVHPATVRHGGDGALYVLLKRRR
ncbi:MAG TPA: Smr/MutS family protein [Candidatus Cybelea sp.]|nr:Smr/MutS family protein [Candidatus Cybelea sp.]